MSLELSILLLEAIPVLAAILAIAGYRASIKEVEGVSQILLSTISALGIPQAVQHLVQEMLGVHEAHIKQFQMKSVKQARDIDGQFVLAEAKEPRDLLQYLVTRLVAAAPRERSGDVRVDCEFVLECIAALLVFYNVAPKRVRGRYWAQIKRLIEWVENKPGKMLRVRVPAIGEPFDERFHCRIRGEKGTTGKVVTAVYCPCFIEDESVILQAEVSTVAR